MTLNNFSFIYESQLAVSLSGGPVWDLHNSCAFESMQFDPMSGDATATWRILDARVHSDQDNAKYNKIEIRFSSVTKLEILRADTTLASEHRRTLDSIVSVRDESTQELRGLIFVFMDGTTILVQANTAFCTLV